MRSWPLLALVGAICLTVWAQPAGAQAPVPQTWVSGVGDDMNASANPPCSRFAPCKTFAGAISVTTTGGEIDCLDPGGFGALTITKSITIDCEKTSNGGVLVAGTNGINVTTGTVTLRGLDFDGAGQGAQGVIGVSIASGANVRIQNCKIYGFAGGMSPAGISLASGATLVLTNTRITNNAAGVLASGRLIVRDSLIDQNAGNGITVQSGANVTVDRTTLALNGGTGLSVAGGGATVLLGNSTITDNAAGVAVSAGTLYSFKQNQIAGNTNDGTPIPAFPGPGGPLQ